MQAVLTETTVCNEVNILGIKHKYSTTLYEKNIVSFFQIPLKM